MSNFMCKMNGILFENDVLQIGVKSEFKASFGRLGIFYGNKANASLLEFNTNVSADTAGASLSFDSQRTPEILATGAQVQQMIHVECLGDFDGIPVLSVSYKLNACIHRLCLYLPITINKFLSNAEMTADVFKARWEALTK
ncbi:AP-2 complex subunit alpha-1 [Cichlidogyrus casuarinus]|uniref:AP-2 complex subunit alpha-1 n=1 Tax=Cichlidogyrus casuarinus TaxID=1844966 RepID=A0ABD2Q469_9PLAT